MSRVEELRAEDGTRLAMTAYGGAAADERPPVVVVHGWGDHQGWYAELCRSLAGRGFSVWSYDQRGHGRSEGRRGDLKGFDELTRDLEAVLQHALRQSKGEAAFVVGHSMGGLVVLRALQTGTIAISACVISAPWLATAARVPGWKRALAALLLRVAPGFAVPGRLDPRTLTSDPDKIAEHRKDALFHGRMSPRMFREVQWAQELVVGATAALPVPALFFIPRCDPLVDSSTSLAWLARMGRPDTRVVELPDCRHEPFSEVDRAIRFDEVGGFFEKVLGTGAVDEQGVEPSSSGQPLGGPSRNQPERTHRDDDEQR